MEFWRRAAQGFKAKKRIKAEPADKETELEFLGNSRLRNFRIPREFYAGILVLGNSRIPTIIKKTK